MYDLHSHLIWGVDDGAQDLETSKALLKMAAQSGTREIFATSHIIDLATSISWSEMIHRCQILNAWAQEENLHITIYPGGEVYMNWDNLSHLTSTKDYRLAESDYMLVEMPMREIPIYAEDFFYQLKVAGIRPILAHPERYPALFTQPELIHKWRQEGLLMQINGGSLYGFYGPTVQGRVKWLLENSLVDFIGSDAHSLDGRHTDLTKARSTLKGMVNPEYAELLTITNGHSIIKNKVVEPTVVDRLTKFKGSQGKKSLWQKIFG